MPLPIHPQNPAPTPSTRHISLSPHPTPALRQGQIDTVRLEIPVDDVLGMEVAVGVEVGGKLAGGYLISLPQVPQPPS